jgi:hypothetical protein
MQTLRIALLLVLSVASITLAGCTTLRDYRDAPWDPKPGHSLLDQIPNWDHAARTRCGGHLRDSERGHRSANC